MRTCPLCKHYCLSVDDHDLGCPIGWDTTIDITERIPRPANHPDVIARFKAKISIEHRCGWLDTPCHIWTAGKSRGGMRFSEKAWYGTFNPGGEIVGGVRAHVYAAWLAGKIEKIRVPVGFNLDHVCVQSLCVNADHLELVEDYENQMRKWAGRR